MPRNWLMAQVNVKPVLTYDVAFEQGSPVDGAAVMQTLSEIRDGVAAILYLFDALSGDPIPHT